MSLQCRVKSGSPVFNINSASCFLIPTPFKGEQCAFAFDAPPIAGEVTARAQHAMAGNSDRNFIRGASSSHRTYRLWRTDASRNVRITCGRARWNLAQRLPDSPLKRRAAHIERQIQTDFRRLNEANHFGNHLLELFVATDQLRFGKTVLQILDELVRAVAQRNGGDAFFRRRHENRTQRAFPDCETNGFSRSTSAKILRPHAKHLCRLPLEAARGI